MREIEEQTHYSTGHGGNVVPAEEQKDVEEMAPPGWEGSVKAMKKHRKIKTPWALAWYMKKKGAHPHYTKSGKKKRKK